MSPSLASRSNATLTRLVYERDFGPSQLTQFASAAVTALLYPGSEPPELSTVDIDALVAEIDEQKAAEELLPPGARLSRIAHHPARIIVDHHQLREFAIPIRVSEILVWLRKITCWQPDIDEIVARAIGVSLPILAEKLASTAKTDPVSFFAMISFGFQHSGLDHGIRCDPVTRRKGERIRRFHQPPSLAANMMLVAEWVRAVEIVRFNDLHRQETVHGLLAFLLARPRSGSQPDIMLDAVSGKSSLAVPSQFAFLRNPKSSHRDQLEEIMRVQMGKPRQGPQPSRPLFHYYGLGSAETLGVAFLDLVRAARGLKANSAALGAFKPATRVSEDFGDDALIDVIEKTLNQCGIAWALPQDFALRARFLRDRYAREYPVFGSACRFDPRFWLHSARDAPLFARLFTYSTPQTGSLKQLPDTFTATMAIVRESFQGLLPHSSPDVPPTSGDLRLSAEVVAHLATSATELTRDPVLFGLLEHSMAMSGYQPRRGKGRTSSPASPCGKAGRWFGCHLPPGQLSTRRYPDLPWAGATASFP